MAMAIATSHTHPAEQVTGDTQAASRASQGLAGKKIIGFFTDLAKQLRHEMTHSIDAPSSDFFRDHMNALAICYFAIIVGFLLISLPFLVYFVVYRTL